MPPEITPERVRQEDRNQSKYGDQGTTLSARMRLRRALIVTKFAGRAMKAAKEASVIESVDDVVLEISEAVAAHWSRERADGMSAGTRPDLSSLEDS
jgi:hypothetical protein